MKKVLLLLSVIGLAGCGSYTLKNNWEKNVKAGETVVQPGECSELSYALFGLFGVFPITITNESNGDLPKASKDESYGASHYVVTKEGEVKPSDEACEVGPGKSLADEKPEEEKPLGDEEQLEAQWKHVDKEGAEDAKDAEEGDVYWENLQETEKANQQGEEEGTQQQDENANQQREEGAQQQDENTNQGVDKNKTYEAGHYVVTAEGEVNLSDKACQDMILSQETVEDSRRSEGVVSEEDLTPIETTAKDTPNATQQPEKITAEKTPKEDQKTKMAEDTPNATQQPEKTLKTVKTPPPVTTVVEEPPKQNQQPEQQSEGTTEENSFSWSWLWDWIPGL